MTRCGVLGLAALLVAAGVSACTTTAATSPPTQPDRAPTSTVTAPPTPIAAGPTRSVTATSCPFVARHDVHYTLGVRLGRTTVQQSGGRAVGCRFYALQHGYLHRTENLPGRHQPVLEIATTRWSSDVGAHNAFVRLAEEGTNDTRAALGDGNVGLCFQTDFDPHDHGQDYACAASSGGTEVVVRSADTTGPFNTVAITRKVLRALAA